MNVYQIEVLTEILKPQEEYSHLCDVLNTDTVYEPVNRNIYKTHKRAMRDMDDITWHIHNNGQHVKVKVTTESGKIEDRYFKPLNCYRVIKVKLL